MATEVYTRTNDLLDVPSYYWRDRDGNEHGPYHNRQSAEHGKRKWEEAGLD